MGKSTKKQQNGPCTSSGSNANGDEENLFEKCKEKFQVRLFFDIILRQR
jgi:hypothetical protein